MYSVMRQSRNAIGLLKLLIDLGPSGGNEAGFGAGIFLPGSGMLLDTADFFDQLIDLDGLGRRNHIRYVLG
jgi:hypothetical protein